MQWRICYEAHETSGPLSCKGPFQGSELNLLFIILYLFLLLNMSSFSKSRRLQVSYEVDPPVCMYELWDIFSVLKSWVPQDWERTKYTAYWRTVRIVGKFHYLQKYTKKRNKGQNAERWRKEGEGRWKNGILYEGGRRKRQQKVWKTSVEKNLSLREWLKEYSLVSHAFSAAVLNLNLSLFLEMNL